MKQVWCVIMLMVCAGAVWSEPLVLNKRTVCDDREIIFRMVTDDFGEIPQWHGVAEPHVVNAMLTVNLKTGTWTLIEYTSERACVTAVGVASTAAWGMPI